MKKVIYILNFLFLTLSVFGGSVFAQQPEYYLDEEGIAQPVPENMVSENLTQRTAGNKNTIGTGWYYIDGPWSPGSSNNIVLATGADVNIVVVNNNSAINLTGKGKIFVPSNGSLNFYSATNEGGTSTPASLTITGSGDFVVGNYGNGETALDYPNGNFGDITFNSGSYTVVNSKSSYPAIGSATTSGGTITVNQAAEVIANTTNPGTAVGTPGEGQSCIVNVAGGLLNCSNSDNSQGLYAYGIDAGSGSVNVKNQGKIISYNTLENWGNNLNLDSGGIVAYPTVQNYPVEQNQWSALVGGSVTLPVFGNYPQDLDPPASSQQWNSVTVDTGAVLTLGTEDPEGNLQKADFFVTGTSSFVLESTRFS